MNATKILLVDDKPENILALESLIASPDVTVLSATSANDALALLIDNEFALALLDVQMPGMDGFELAAVMRSAERSKSVPIIFVTASQGEETHIFAGYDHGAVDYLLKPLNAHVVRSKVRVFVDLDQKNRLLKEKSAALEEKLCEVKALHDAAEAANHAKSRFLANMSHEIRTPLGAVLGFAELLKIEDQSASERQHCITAITRNGQLLLQLIDDVLDLAKIEAERVEIDIVPTALAELINDLKSVHGHRAAEKGIALSFLTKGQLPKQIQTDPLRLKQILNNLLSNAVKFTDRGRVIVTVQCDGPAERPRLSFSVRDTGRGLASGEAGRLFQPFMQADASTTRKYGGTGLGLVIAKQLARLLGGDVILTDSAPGVGSTFTASVSPGALVRAHMMDGQALLDGHARSATRQVIALPRVDGTKVLLVDDAHDNRALISRILKFAGAAVETAEDGNQAVEKALAGSYDIVLCAITHNLDEPRSARAAQFVLDRYAKATA